MAACSDNAIRNIFYVCLQLTFIAQIICSTISDLRMCGNQECTAIISYARTLARHRPLDPVFLRFERGETVKILSKSAGKRLDLWEGEIGGSRGYFPKSFVREYKVEIQNPEYEVSTEEHVPFEDKIMGKASSKANEAHKPVAEKGGEPGVSPVDTGQGTKDDTEIEDDTNIDETEVGGTDLSERVKLDESDNKATTVSGIQDKSKDAIKENLDTVVEKEIDKEEKYLDNPDYPDDTDLPDDVNDDSEIDETDLDEEGYIDEKTDKISSAEEGYIDKKTDKISSDKEPNPEPVVDKGESQKPHVVGGGQMKSDEILVESGAVKEKGNLDDTMVKMKQESDDIDDKKQQDQDMKSDAEVEEGDLNNILRNKMTATSGDIQSEPKLENNQADPVKAKDETGIDETEFGMDDADETKTRSETEKGKSESETADDESKRQFGINVGETDHSKPENDKSSTDISVEDWMKRLPETDMKRIYKEENKMAGTKDTSDRMEGTEQDKFERPANDILKHDIKENEDEILKSDDVTDKSEVSVKESNTGTLQSEEYEKESSDKKETETLRYTHEDHKDQTEAHNAVNKDHESVTVVKMVETVDEQKLDDVSEIIPGNEKEHHLEGDSESEKTKVTTDATPEEIVAKVTEEAKQPESDHLQIPTEHMAVEHITPSSEYIPEESPVSNININPVADVNLSKISPSVTDLMNKISPSRSGVTVIDGTELPADVMPKDTRSDTHASLGRTVEKENIAFSDKIFLDSFASRLNSPSVNEKSEHVTLETSKNNFSPVDVSFSFVTTSTLDITTSANIMETTLTHTKAPSLESAIVDTSSKTESGYQVKATTDGHFVVIDGTSVPAEYIDSDYTSNVAASATTKTAPFSTSATIAESTKSIIGEITPDLPDKVNTYKTQVLEHEEASAIRATESIKTFYDDTPLQAQENLDSIDDSLSQNAITTSFKEADVSATFQPPADFQNKTQPDRVEQPKVQPSIHDDPYKTREFMSRKPLSYKTDHPGIQGEKDSGSEGHGQGQSQDMSGKDNSEKVEGKSEEKVRKDLIGQMQDHTEELDTKDLFEHMDDKKGEHNSINSKKDEYTKEHEVNEKYNVTNRGKVDENNNMEPGDGSEALDKNNKNVKLKHKVEVDENNNKPDTVTPIPVEGEKSQPPVEWDTVLPHEGSKSEDQSSKESNSFEHILTRKITDGDIDEQPSQPNISWMQTLEPTFKIIIDKLPPSVQSFLEHEPLGMSPQGTILTTVITLVVLVTFSCSTCACRSGKKTSKKEPIVVVRDLEEKLFITTKEKENLEDELKLKNEKILELEQDFQQQEEFSGNAEKDLQNYKLHNEALKKQVNTLQEELSAHTEELQSKTKELHGREKQISSLERQYHQAEEKISSFERQVQEANRELLEKGQEILTINTQVQNLSEQVHHLETRKQQLLDEGEEWGQRVRDLTEQVEQFTEENKRMQEDLAFKENELEVLRDCFLQLKAFENEDEMKEDLDVGASIQDKLRLMMDVSQVNATLKAVEEERNVLDNKYRIEIEARKEMEDQIEQLKKKMETMQTDKMKAERQCTEAQTKLQVLTNYFKEKEADLTRKLGEQEVLKTQNMNKLEYADEKTSQLEQEKEIYRTQVEDLKREISTAERDFRSQIAANEKKAHENWLAARAAERELKESRHENGILRQKLTEQERRFTHGPSGLIRPLPTRGLPPPGMLNGPPPLPPGIDRSPSERERPGSRGEDDYRGSPGPERIQPPSERRMPGGPPPMGPRPPPPHFDVRSPPPYGMRPPPPPHILDRRPPPSSSRFVQQTPSQQRSSSSSKTPKSGVTQHHHHGRTGH
ncbi:hypothetical protein CHS0354_042689 [Potamilus streckersoni]|uniref:SH3 domain-containing protein n=1 Tax=Potamilus streckersoni TaxID=2493646 RepID=A0AAE0S9B8_9BIVA|nr:hypothetical protein CHS0354_042689 [Potamilus streckersoni]